MNIFQIKIFRKLKVYNLIYYALIIFSIVTLAWLLKNCLKVGDEVVAAISASLITLFGVYLTNENNQLALDKQLQQQKETFIEQLKDQAEGFKEQIKHQNFMLDRQLKHQSEEKEIERKRKFKHDIYRNMAEQLSEIETFFSSSMFMVNSNFELIEKIAHLNKILNTAKTVSSVAVMEVSDRLHDKCCDIAKRYSSESFKLFSLKHEEISKKEVLNNLIQMNSKIMENFLRNGNQPSFQQEIKSILSEREKVIKELSDLENQIAIESKRLLDLLKEDILIIKADTQIILILINSEQGYNSLNELINKPKESN